MLIFKISASDLLYLSRTPLFCHFLFVCLMKTRLGETAALQGVKIEMVLWGTGSEPN